MKITQTMIKCKPKRLELQSKEKLSVSHYHILVNKRYSPLGRATQKLSSDSNFDSDKIKAHEKVPRNARRVLH